MPRVGCYVRWPLEDPVYAIRAHNTPGGWIYAVREDGALAVKIGYTCKPVACRLRELEYEQRKSLLCVGAVLVDGYRIRAVERRVHRLLRTYHLSGEWFFIIMTQEALEELVRRAITLVKRDHRPIRRRKTALVG